MRFRCWLPILPVLLTALSFAQSHVIQNSHTTEDLRGVSAISTKVVWASGTHGTYLRTLDGGETWTPAQVPGAEGLDFRDVEAFSTDEAYLLAAGTGDQSRIYKTTNGGKTWALQFTNREPKGFYDCMAFWDLNNGIAVGDPVDGKFELITTDDGGHWKPLAPATLPLAVEGEGAFAASGSCITVRGDSNAWFATGGKAARVFASTDRGKTWTVVETPIVHGADSSGSFSIFFRDGDHGIISGGDYKNPDQQSANLAYSDDRGKTWKLSSLQPQPFFSALGYIDPTSGHGLLAVGSAHAAFSDDVTGEKWLQFLDTNLNALGIAAPRDAWAVGPKGIIMHWWLEQ
jgi:photosystem II stability/assembly factor-like uncharacterized protein